MHHSLRLIAAVAAAWPVLASTQAAPAPLTAEAMWQLKRIGAPAISPDGKFAVYGVTRYDADNDKGEADLYRVSTAGGRPERLTSVKGNESEPAWSPDGHYIAFVAKRGDDKVPQLYVIAAHGGEATRVGDVPTGVSAPKWFPDSRRIAFITAIWPDITDWAQTRDKLKAREDSKVTALAWDRPPVTHWDHFVEDRVPHLYVDLDRRWPAGRRSRSARDARSSRARRTRIPTTSRRTAARSLSSPTPTLPASTRTTTSTSSPRRAARRATSRRTTPRATTRRATARTAAGSRTAQQTIKGFYGDTQQLWLIDRKSDARRRVAADWDRSVSGIAWAPDSKSFYASIDDAGTGRIYRFDVAKGTQHALTAASSFSALAIDGKPAVLVALRAIVHRAADAGGGVDEGRRGDEARGPQRRAARRDRLRQGRERDLRRARTARTSRCGSIYPPGFDPAKKYPLYLLLHGGPHNGIQDSWTFRWNAQVFAGWGYVTAWHNFHGSSGFGQAFADSINPDGITKPYEDTIKAARMVRVEAVDRRGAHGGGRRQLRRLPRRGAARPRAPVQDARRARGRLRQLHDVRRRLRRGEEPLLRGLGAARGVGEVLAVDERRELQDADAGDPRPARPARAAQ